MNVLTSQLVDCEEILFVHFFCEIVYADNVALGRNIKVYDQTIHFRGEYNTFKNLLLSYKYFQ